MKACLILLKSFAVMRQGMLMVCTETRKALYFRFFASTDLQANVSTDFVWSLIERQPPYIHSIVNCEIGVSRVQEH